MSLSDWLSYAKDRQRVAAIIILVLGILAFGWAALRGPQCYQSEGQKAETEAQRLRLQHPSIYQPNCQVPKDADEADLCAQRDMARAAECLVDLTWFQLVVGGVSLVAIWATFRQTRRAADIAENALMGLERPYIFVKINNTRFLTKPTAERPKIEYRLVNQGKTPAILRGYSIGLLDNPALPLVSTFEVERKIYTTIGAGQEHPADEWLSVAVDGSKPGDTYTGAKAIGLVLYGMIEYDDPTGARHYDSVCMRGLAGGGFSLQGMDDYNWHHTEYPKRNPRRLA